MAGRQLPRLPQGPLSDECKRQGTTIAGLTRSIGMDPRNCYGGTLAWITADRLACALGLHPASIWGEDWWAVARAADEMTAQAHEKKRHWKRDRSWSDVERSWRDWRLCRDRVELHRDEWAVA